MIGSKMAVRGELRAEVHRARSAPWAWRLRNRIRPAFWLGFLANLLAVIFSRLTKIPTLTAELRGRVILATGEVIDYGILGYRYVTDLGVAFLVDDWDDDTTDITNMNYHACGTDNTAEDQTDSDLGAESTAITDRGTGVKSQPAANQLRSVATQNFTGSGAIVEHGLFSVVTESAGVLWDRTVFSAINVDNGDSIEFTYTCTLTAGS